MTPEQTAWLVILGLFFGGFVLLVGVSRLQAYLTERRVASSVAPTPADEDDVSPPAQVIWLHGSGPQVSEVLTLRAGLHRAAFRLPAGVVVRLLSLDGVVDERLFEQTGVGSVAFRVTRAGRYVVQVEPHQADSPWQIELRPLDSTP